MSSTSTLITADEFSSMVHERPSELIRGEVVEMTNPGSLRGQVCSNASFLLQTWSRLQQTPWNVIGNDAGVLTERNPDTVRGPDVYVIRHDRLPGGVIPSGHMTVAPELCVEVMSPTDRWRDIHSKVGDFFQAGVLEVWVIDPMKRRIHLFQGDDEPVVLGVGDRVRSDNLPNLTIEVQEFFYLT